jgi:hypothetical protein
MRAEVEMDIQPVTSEPRSPQTASIAIRLDGEAFGKATQVAEGFWIIATRHRPGLSMKMFEINNRCLVFRVNDAAAGGQALLVVNAVDPAQAISEVQRLERETGLVVRTIVSPGGGHHLHVAPWIEVFTKARILLPPTRIPRTANGKKLMAMPRVETMNVEDPLPQFRGQIDAVLFHGLMGLEDHKSAAEGGPDTMWAMMKMMFKMKTKGPTDPVDELWLRHVPSGTVVAGENMAWYFSPGELRKMPFMARGMLKPDKVWIWTMARKVADPAVVASCWKKILAWPMRTLMTFHDPPTVAVTNDPHAALEAAVREVKQSG